jgi:hypothetical protein
MKTKYIIIILLVLFILVNIFINKDKFTNTVSFATSGGFVQDLQSSNNENKNNKIFKNIFNITTEDKIEEAEILEQILPKLTFYSYEKCPKLYKLFKGLSAKVGENDINDEQIENVDGLRFRNKIRSAFYNIDRTIKIEHPLIDIERKLMPVTISTNIDLHLLEKLNDNTNLFGTDIDVKTEASTGDCGNTGDKISICQYPDYFGPIYSAVEKYQELINNCKLISLYLENRIPKKMSENFIRLTDILEGEQEKVKDLRDLDPKALFLKDLENNTLPSDLEYQYIEDAHNSGNKDYKTAVLFISKAVLLAKVDYTNEKLSEYDNYDLEDLNIIKESIINTISVLNKVKIYDPDIITDDNNIVINSINNNIDNIINNVNTLNNLLKNFDNDQQYIVSIDSIKEILDYINEDLTEGNLYNKNQLATIIRDFELDNLNEKWKNNINSILDDKDYERYEKTDTFLMNYIDIIDKFYFIKLRVDNIIEIINQTPDNYEEIIRVRDTIIQTIIEMVNEYKLHLDVNTDNEIFILDTDSYNTNKDTMISLSKDVVTELKQSIVNYINTDLNLNNLIKPTEAEDNLNDTIDNLIFNEDEKEYLIKIQDRIKDYKDNDYSKLVNDIIILERFNKDKNKDFCAMLLLYVYYNINVTVPSSYDSSKITDEIDETKKILEDYKIDDLKPEYKVEDKIVIEIDSIKKELSKLKTTVDQEEELILDNPNFIFELGTNIINYFTDNHIEQKHKQVSFNVKTDFTEDDVINFVEYCFNLCCFGAIDIDLLAFTSNHYRVLPCYNPEHIQSENSNTHYYILPERIRKVAMEEGKEYTRAKCNGCASNIIIFFDKLPDKFKYYEAIEEEPDTVKDKIINNIL